ncbi:biotin synthase-related radical SAM superfamily protein [Methanolinea mesophila]|uniref:radical SAM protein n=1 Tax=Methanolinea mesophila TaxID=547055 RepID=UPI001AE179D4|nr:radical SAM protein [Methanolinea mesophila]MBP1928466.1 biotin synthase-related radical SAM superfamily protein [Methanolinea mesophila]
MEWDELKAGILAAGSARITGLPADDYLAVSTAGPGAGGEGSVFFSVAGRRVRIPVEEEGTLVLEHRGSGIAVLCIGRECIEGILEPVALHCPRQAYITVSAGCIYHCRYCRVPALGGKRKSVAEIREMVGRVRDRIDAISITSGVAYDPKEEEKYVISVIRALAPFSVPIGVSIYPVFGTPDRLRAEGAAEVKFNVEAATDRIFRTMCPGLDRREILRILARSVEVFGKNRVYSNVIIGLGETDAEMEDCIGELAGMGVIPVLRPLNPAGELAGWARPSAERLLRLFRIHERILREKGLDPCSAVTMCSACTGCDMVPGRDA